jgi:hypothetical protein
MADESLPPAVPPRVPSTRPTLSANIALVSYGPAGFVLHLYDQRFAPVDNVGDPSALANFEIGRFQLTPAAFRQLQENVDLSLQRFKALHGTELPTLSQMIARDHTAGMERDLQPPYPPADPGPHL